MATSHLFWPGMACTMPASAGPGTAFVNGTNLDYLVPSFDGGTADEHCFFTGVMPQAYVANGAITFYIYWGAATGASASDNVSWDVSFLGRVNDEVLDAAFNTPVTVNDLVLAVGDVHVASAAFATPTLSPGDYITVKLNRDFDEPNGGTSMAEDAYLFGLELRED